MKSDKRRKQQFPTSFKSHNGFMKSKIRQFYIGMAAIAEINKGSAFLPKKVRDNLELAKKSLFHAACDVITIYSLNKDL